MSYDFEILGEIYDIETIAYPGRIREIARLYKVYGKGRWRKRKGCAKVRLRSGTVVIAEIHWYEMSGVGRKELKIKRYI